ncbi:hypothetical protein JCM14108_962 [Lentilactobacillus farraginis DSM 18382 = JCM 14108]|uniref:Uncharacterized protein n=2 Tax=Lentilactobacillus farraginis TaxID=390841 RepID=X0PHT2_9LACO|nr:hypothetical protein JCM14108_962 [Lentilactobacillus farraginis DSM 18382 = JCM 14108]
MILTALMTGIRYEEAIGLTWDNLELDQSLMHINRAYDYIAISLLKPKPYPRNEKSH